MTIRETFAPIRDAILRGEASVRSFTVGDEEYCRNFFPDERLIILGSGHIAQPLCRYGADLGFSVTVADDRPDFANRERFPEADHILCDSFENAIAALNINERDYVCILTRGHRFDTNCLRAILPGTYPKYLGLVGSRRRVSALKDMLEGEGFAREKLDSICTPIGLPINALTPNEIAISIVAELILYRRKGAEHHRSGSLLVEEDAPLDVIESVLDPEPRVLMTVYETHGSTPVKSGAMMTMDLGKNITGTIGGGLGEALAMQEGLTLIGTGKTRLMHIDMTKDVTADEDMVCGGDMDVLLEDIT